MDKNFIVFETNRLDKFLASKIEASRNQIEQLIKKEYVKVDGKIVSNKRRTLYVIERKVGEEEFTEEFNRLLDSYSKKKFKYDERNYFVNVILLENNEYEIALGNTKSLKEINKKYYYKEIAEEIIRKLKEFIK